MSQLLVNRAPGLIGIEALHALKRLQRIGPEVLLVNDSVLANDERLHTCDPVFCRRSRERKPTDHGTLYEKIHLSHRRGGTLPLQNLEIVAVIRLSFIAIALLQGLDNILSDGASPAAIR